MEITTERILKEYSALNAQERRQLLRFQMPAEIYIELVDFLGFDNTVKFIDQKIEAILNARGGTERLQQADLTNDEILERVSDYLILQAAGSGT